MSAHRAERVGERIHEILARVLREEVRDPRVGFATLTGVRVSADLVHAVVFVSRLGTADDRKETVEALNRMSGFLRRRVAQEIRSRHTPELRFEDDASLESAFRVEALLSRWREESDRRDEEPS